MSALLLLLGFVVLIVGAFLAVKSVIRQKKGREDYKVTLKKARNCVIAGIVMFGVGMATSDDSAEKPKQDTVAQEQAQPAAQQEAQAAAEAEQAEADKPKVDFAKITAEVIPSIKKQHPDVLSLDITPESNRIIFRAVLNYDTNPKEALEIADSILRKYASEANFTNSKIPGPGGEKNAYGGLYDYYDAVLEIIPEGSEDDKKDWFIKQTIKGNKTNFLTTQKSHGGITRN